MKESTLYNGRSGPKVPPRHSAYPFVILAVIWTGFFLLSCAGQIPPGGGPVDLIPPAIIRTVPDSGAVHVTAPVVELEFSKYVDRRTVEESIFISPHVGPLEFDWSGREVRISFRDSLRAATTYVVTVGTDVVDVRGRNRMAATFGLAFSTGDSIDQGRIRGRIIDDKPEGVMVFAYRLEGRMADTLDPSHTRPDFLVQSGTGGLFSFTNLAFGTYRLVAVRDEYKNMLYDRGTDQYGVTTGDVLLTARHPEANGVWFQLSREDTVRPFLSSARAVDRSRVQFRLSEQIDTARFAGGHIVLTDTTTGAPVPLALRYLPRSSPAVAFLVTATPLDSGRTYRLTVAGLFDRAGNPLDTANASTTFSVFVGRDTTRPGVSVGGLRDSVKDVDPWDPIDLSFTEPVLQPAASAGIVLLDSAGAVVSTGRAWLTASDLRVTPGVPLLSRAWYQLRVRLDSLRDYQGNSWRDSTMRVHFQTQDLRMTGIVGGTVTDTHPADSSAVVLTIRSIDLTPARQRAMRLKRPSPFLFDRLREGKYVLGAYRDRDGNGEYSYGLPHPFLPAESFTLSPDTVKVRARWNVEGVRVPFDR